MLNNSFECVICKDYLFETICLQSLNAEFEIRLITCFIF